MGLPSTVRNCLSSHGLHFPENFQQLLTIKMAMSKVKQNFHSDSEALINKQINMELYASYVYLSMSAYFARDDIALMGFSKRFRDASNEEKEHAESLIDYQNMRGGRVVFREILNRPAMNGEQHWKPLRQALSLRRLSTSPSTSLTRSSLVDLFQDLCLSVS